ncbi:BPSS1187 family protein [Solimonas terrae]|uniref:Alpha/beta hydrolase n=1 Tax=Solimonas terrae TaxID=1396819 RepID=A0A6M2BS07_9GAMM|nr:hypothetical protein [Solimonas terrae]NGY05124.1 hypothetical protein [Solimonas terrae]
MLLGFGNRAFAAVDSLYVQPADTGAGISRVYSQNAKHYVLQPDKAGRKNVLVIFLGGSGSTPSDYSTFAEYAASLGYGVLDLQYPNGLAVGTTCMLSDACFTNLRGETSFGARVAYAPGMASFNSTATLVDADNSIVSRVVNLIDYLAHNASLDRAYWAQFLTANANSPYSTSGSGKAYPNWSKIVIAGHSQGGGDAAFIAMHLPASTPARRVVLFSAPNDSIGGGSASWIAGPSATPPAKFWGMHAQDEGTYGQYVSLNWLNLGGLGVGGPNSLEILLGDFGIAALTHRLVLNSAGSSLTQHDSTAANDPYGRYPEDRVKAWAYLLTANGSD